MVDEMMRPPEEEREEDKGRRTTSLNPKAKTENNSNVQNAARHGIHTDSSDV